MKSTFKAGVFRPWTFRAGAFTGVGVAVEEQAGGSGAWIGAVQILNAKISTIPARFTDRLLTIPVSVQENISDWFGTELAGPAVEKTVVNANIKTMAATMTERMRFGATIQAQSSFVARPARVVRDFRAERRRAMEDYLLISGHFD